MAADPDPHDVERDAWRWYRHGQGRWNKSKEGSPEELEAIQIMSWAAMTAYAAQEAQQRQRRR